MGLFEALVDLVGPEGAVVVPSQRGAQRGGSRGDSHNPPGQVAPPLYRSRSILLHASAASLFRYKLSRSSQFEAKTVVSRRGTAPAVTTWRCRAVARRC